MSKMTPATPIKKIDKETSRNLPRCATQPRERGLKKEERDLILRNHRHWQSNILGAIDKLPIIHWDPRLEREAQRYQYSMPQK